VSWILEAVNPTADKGCRSDWSKAEEEQILVGEVLGKEPLTQTPVATSGRETALLHHQEKCQETWPMTLQLHGPVGTRAGQPFLIYSS